MDKRCEQCNEVIEPKKMRKFYDGEKYRHFCCLDCLILKLFRIKNKAAP